MIKEKNDNIDMVGNMKICCCGFIFEIISNNYCPQCGRKDACDL